MRIKIYKKDGNWHSKLLRNNGGVNSLVIGMISNSFFKSLKIFTINNIAKCYKIK